MNLYPRFVIFNDTDAPEPRMICELVDGRYYYMARLYDKRLREYSMIPHNNVTAVEAFGFEIIEQTWQTDFVLNGKSLAKYKDGKPRNWQSSNREFSMPNVYLE